MGKNKEKKDVVEKEFVSFQRMEGKAEGRAEGRIEGENRFAMLAQILMDGGRNDDLRRAISDRRYREQLYMEIKLS